MAKVTLPMKIFVFGNEILETDNLAPSLMLELSSRFPDIEFIHADPTENWWQGEKELVILDTVVGIKKVTVFNSLDAFEKQAQITPHDYDVYMDLLLMLKMGHVQKIKIVGIPDSQDRKLIDNLIQAISELV
ncbi:hypothetical protein HY469_01020 [Candidatus Roizmanbacteria bacterium]|nr:hypothetical protein [Candidatus Roizmanbacteria bacterium]